MPVRPAAGRVDGVEPLREETVELWAAGGVGFGRNSLRPASSCGTERRHYASGGSCSRRPGKACRERLRCDRGPVPGRKVPRCPASDLSMLGAKVFPAMVAASAFALPLSAHAQSAPSSARAPSTGVSLMIGGADASRSQPASAATPGGSQAASAATSGGVSAGERSGVRAARFWARGDCLACVACGGRTGCADRDGRQRRRH